MGRLRSMSRLTPERKALVEQWKGLPLCVVRRLWETSLDLERLGWDECVSVGNMALVMAALAWKPEGPASFYRYAYVSIRRELVEARRKVGVVRVPLRFLWDKAVRDLPESLKNDIRAGLGVLTGEDGNRRVGRPSGRVFESMDLADGLEKLSDPQRQAVLDHHFGGYDFQEIGGRLGMTRQGAHSHYHQAVKKLKTYLADYATP